MKMPSVMEHNFSQVPQADIPRSSFNRSHGLKTTFNAGLLIPVFFDEALPGDTFNLKMTAFGRLATPLHPVMENLRINSFFFAVPYRLVWDNWQRFNGEQDNPGDSTDFLVPQLQPAPAGGFGENKIYDYFGIPTKIDGLAGINALHFRAHNLIYNEWFRDENLQDSKPVPKDDGPDDPNLYGIYRRGKRHDYFTSSLPFPQKGDAVTLPLGQQAYVSADLTSGGVDTIGVLTDDAPGIPGKKLIAGAGDVNVSSVDADFPLYADLSTATAATINQIREAFQIQKLYERDMRSGTRYTEIIRSHFGTISPDARLQRPEYLGGGSSDIQVNPVAQTTQTLDTGTPQGNLAAVGTLGFSNHGFTKSFTEHTLLIGYICVTADLNYQQGLNRMWSRQGRFDFYWPVLAHLGEQAVLSKEIYADATAADEDVFGYQERYAEYRYKPSLITGLFRSNSSQPLDTWHLAQDFANRPTLSDVFIEETPPIDRIIAVPGEPHFIMDAYFKLHCARPMPTYSVPGLVDHF